MFIIKVEIIVEQDRPLRGAPWAHLVLSTAYVFPNLTSQVASEVDSSIYIFTSEKPEA